MKLPKKIHWSKIAVFLLVLCCAWYGKNLKTWKKNEVIKNDVVIYYAYLPAAFIFHDFSFEFVKSLPADFEGTIWVNDTSDQKPVLKMTMGLAVLWMPFFLMAHLTAHLTGASTLGYSWPYSLSILVAALFYLTLGLIAVRKLLLKYFPDLTTAVVLVLLVSGTNLMYYVISEPGMSHVYTFSLIAIFILNTLKWLEKQTLARTIYLGLLGGLIVLVRPVNIMILVFPALLGITTTNEFENRIVRHLKFILIAGSAAFFVVLPQIIYWRIQTGHFIHNSYGEEGFFFLNPQIFKGLIGFRKGWLIYTPVMLFSIAGLYWIRKTVNCFYIPIVIFLLIYVYVVFSWWCWWYGGSFGSRPMVDIYGILAVPLGITVDKILRSKRLLKFVLLFVLAFMVFLNQFQMKQYRSSLLHWDSMTGRAYMGIFLRQSWPGGYEDMVKSPDYDKALKLGGE